MNGDLSSGARGEMNSSARIPCLDGLRALSILGVLVAHSNGTGRFPVSHWWELPGDLGNLGVRCFFVISGFLITHLLLRELNDTGGISLKDFYIRRIFRIFPAFYAFILCVVTLWLAGLVAVKGSDLGYAATYTINFVEKKSWVVGHLWSLSVEEQFYLLWPMCIVIAGLTNAKRIALGTVALVPLLRVAVWYLLPQYQGLISKAFPTVCDAIATGCLLACFRDWLWTLPRYRAFLNSAWFVLIPATVMASNALGSHARPDMLIGQSMRNLGIALSIDWCLRNSKSLVGKWLSLPFIAWLGTISYSLYLWQQLFLNRGSTAWYCQFPQNVLFAFLLAVISFYAIERPFLKLRARLFRHSKERSVSQPSLDAIPGGRIANNLVSTSE
jgi:peptidoglycan/LPS O-acetylase OafA/YrhL